MMEKTQTALGVTRKLITFRCAGGDVHKHDGAGEESVVQLPQAPDKGSLLIRAAGGPLVNLIELQIEIQAGLDVSHHISQTPLATAQTLGAGSRAPMLRKHLVHREEKQPLAEGRKETHL